MITIKYKRFISFNSMLVYYIILIKMNNNFKKGFIEMLNDIVYNESIAAFIEANRAYRS